MRPMADGKKEVLTLVAQQSVSHTSGPYKGYLTVVARKLPFIDWWPTRGQSVAQAFFSGFSPPLLLPLSFPFPPPLLLPLKSFSPKGMHVCIYARLCSCLCSGWPEKKSSSFIESPASLAPLLFHDDADFLKPPQDKLAVGADRSKKALAGFSPRVRKILRPTKSQGTERPPLAGLPQKHEHEAWAS